MASVAVAVGGGAWSKDTRRAVLWAVENLLPQADRFFLLHVMPSITSIPTPSGTFVPVKYIDSKVVETYVRDVKAKRSEEMIMSFKSIGKMVEVETVILEDGNIATALVQYVSEFKISSLVLGSCREGILGQLLGKPRSSALPLMVSRHAPGSCDIYIVSRSRIITKWGDFHTSGESTSTPQMSQREPLTSSGAKYSQLPGLSSSSSECGVRRSSQDSLTTDIDYADKAYEEENFEQSDDDVLSEIKQLRLELHNTVAMYGRACQELVHVQCKVQLLSSKYQVEAERVLASREREESLRKITAQEKEKVLDAILEVDIAKDVLAIEAWERQTAERAVEKQKVDDPLLSCDKRYRMYTKDEIEVATRSFSESEIIGEGGFGKVYRGCIGYLRVAVKVLHPGASQKKEEFLKEIKVLSVLRHPHVVLLLGACPEIGCLVYEYMENGSLEDGIFRINGLPPLPWSVRFRIVFEVACGIAFFHSSKPEPIVHRDIKPGNILLDKNYVSKIGDVGLAKLISDATPDDITEYRSSMLAGTLYYMDPEYYRTGTVRPKSDLYAFGVTVLQLLTARRPNKLIVTVERAVATGFLEDLLDKSVSDWPLAETEELARIALRCTGLRCRDRPDLETEVLPLLKRLVDRADASKTIKQPMCLHQHLINLSGSNG